MENAMENEMETWICSGVSGLGLVEMMIMELGDLIKMSGICLWKIEVMVL